MGIIAAVLLAAGLLPPYRELWKRRGRVIGINWVFLGMDWFGAFFSLMALGKPVGCTTSTNKSDVTQWPKRHLMCWEGFYTSCGTLVELEARR